MLIGVWCLMHVRFSSKDAYQRKVRSKLRTCEGFRENVSPYCGVKKSGVGEVGGLMKVTEKLQQPHSFEGDCGHRHVLCLRAGQDGGALARQIPTRGP
ncbi:uncharacterized protein [Physcomitrium patens]|uniref:uncharacterized protein isoform X2 n=1 Tax=Physcomitrium patens TaxID=3218 RepID=UPI003CCD8291